MFAGRNWTTKTDLELRSHRAGVEGETVPERVSADVQGLRPDSTITFGGRIGLWSGNLGIAIDGSTFDPDLKAGSVTATATTNFDEIFGQQVSIRAGQNLQVDLPDLPVPTTVTLAGLAMIRLPVGKAPGREQGRIQPYAFAGPVWLVTNERFSGKIGLRLGGGVKLPLGRSFALFGEYRYTAVDNADVKAGQFVTNARDNSVNTSDIIGRINIRTHAGVAGMALSF